MSGFRRDGLAFRQLGAGDPVVVINGYAATKDDWDPTFLTGLSSSSWLVCPDNRGMGESPPVLDGLTVAAMAKDVIGMIETLEIERCDVVGWSMGGFVTQEVAARVPERISKVVLLSTDHGGPDAVKADPETWARLIDHEGTPREQATRILGLLFPPERAGAMDAEFGELVAQARTTLSMAALDAQEHAIDLWHAESASERLASITAPALIVAGAQDVVIPAINSDLLADALPSARRELFADCGHALMAQEPLKLADLINTWFGR
jgi:pimeloyl-ACP methyl ester carboxylesterase